jgi:hypothetical protein
LKKYFFFSLITLFVAAACGGPRIVTTNPALGGPLPVPASAPKIDDVPANTGGGEEMNGEDVAGPFLSPAIPETVYQPYLRRAETPAPALPFPDNSCHLAVEVRNYDGVDGCGILLETDSGTLFLVGTTPRGDPLEAGTRISIGYELMKDYKGSSCGNADAVIRITCMRLLRVSSGVPRPVVCEPYDKPSRWLLNLAQGYSATYVTRFPWEGGRFVYLPESPFGQSLFDCRGYQICQPRKNCLGFIKKFSEGVVIYEG